MESKALAILDVSIEPDFDDHPAFLAARVMPGQWAQAYWDMGVRQTGLIAQRALQYDPYRERVEKRLRRYKSRLRDHHNGARAEFPSSAARERIIAAEDEDGTEPAPLNPVVVSESTLQLRTLTVGEAVMQLDLTDKPAVVFRNSAHGEINVVYRRPDGNIGWIDAHADKGRA